jgi:O-antigen ligase
MHEKPMRKIVLLEIAICIVPAMLAVQLGEPLLGARWLFTTLLVLLVANLLFAPHPFALALTIGLLPGIMLLRDLVAYNSVPVVLAGAIAGLGLRSPDDLTVLRRPVLTWLLLLAFLYWLLSYVLTTDYAANFRVLELAFSAIAIVLLAKYPDYLTAAVYGVGICLLAIGLALLGHGDRLGMARIEGVTLGNPVSYGAPLAFVLTLVLADDGRWLSLQDRRTLRLTLSVIAGLLLALSTSRVSWLVAAACTGAILLFSRRRALTISFLLFLVTAGAVTLRSERGALLKPWYERSFGPNRTLQQRTSGRWDQWLVFREVLTQVPLWGFGPGSGREVYAEYSARTPGVTFQRGRPFAWHSLYQQLIVETGVIGMALLLLGLGHILIADYQRWRGHAELAPLLGTLSFMLIALTVSGLDAAAGLFLGLGLLPTAADA